MGTPELIRVDPVYDVRARDGTWCKLPYPDHPKGCPNFPRCPSEHIDFMNVRDLVWYAIIEEFDLAAYAQRMKLLHPEWTERNCRNLIRWQGGVRARLRRKAYPDYPNRPADRIVLEIPEACGINVFETMKTVGIEIDRTPIIVRKVMLIGVRNEGLSRC